MEFHFCQSRGKRITDEDLEEAAKTMSRVQWNNEFSEGEAESVAAFLRALTGEYKGKRLE